jgi:metal-sulfur cluster biosynthetic enzyme
MSENSITEAVVFENLRQVIDPEIGCNIVDLGLVYSVAIHESKVVITMTLTTPGCPMHDSIRGGVEQALLQIEGVADVEVELVWEPRWNPSMMTEFGRQFTGVGNF